MLGIDYDAKYFAELFVKVAKYESSRRSYKHGISRGTGHIPFDTGRTQNSVRVEYVLGDRASVFIGGDEVPYAFGLQFNDFVNNTSVPNRHKNFVQKFSKMDFVKELKVMFDEVTVQ